MLGAIAGDIIGSVYEFNHTKTEDFPLFSKNSHFTDDTVLTIATADCILNGGINDKASMPFKDKYREYFNLYPNAGYGNSFSNWAKSGNPNPYNSWGNGSAMRVSPIGFAFDNLEDVLKQAKSSAEVTHNHPEGINGAQAVASAIFLAKTGESKEAIKKYIEDNFGYDMNTPLKVIKNTYQYDVSCQGTVPPAIRAFFESESFEDAVRKGISLGGDSDTIACITGGIAEAYYKIIPRSIVRLTMSILDDKLRSVLSSFNRKFNCRY